MKSSVIACAIIVLLVLLIVANSIVVSKIMDRMVEQLSSIVFGDGGEALTRQVHRLRMGYKEKELFLSLTVSDRYLETIDSCYIDMLSGAQANDEVGFMTAKNRLAAILEQQRRLSGFNLSSLL